jgi:glutathionyl-hydroquinone reductase
MNQLVNGIWQDESFKPHNEGGEFKREKSRFHHWITADGSSGFKAEPGRYHLYVSYACPWAHRTLIFRRLKGLEGHVGVSVVHPFLGEDAPRSTRAGLAVWETDPESYWGYFTYVFANQPQERYSWGQPELLARFAAAADVAEPSAIRALATDQNAYSARIERTVTSAQANEIWTVPRVLYDGEVTAPTLDASSTREQFSEAANR